eukprot:scaffold1501_cov352-Pavlova_lutheri.AAC.40
MEAPHWEQAGLPLEPPFYLYIEIALILDRTMRARFRAPRPVGPSNLPPGRTPLPTQPPLELAPTQFQHPPEKAVRPSQVGAGGALCE